MENLLFLKKKKSLFLVPKISIKEQFPQSMGHEAWFESEQSCDSSFSTASSFTTVQEFAVRGRDTSPASVEPGKSQTTFTASTSGCYASWVGPQHSTSLPLHGFICSSAGTTWTVSGGLASTSQPVSLAHSDDQTWLGHSYAILPGSPVSCLPHCQTKMPLSCVQGLRSCW